MQDNDFIQRACKAVEDAKVVSFDIFDTLLLRPYVSPKDLFLHLEEQYGCVGFRDERVDAERRCRKKNNNLQDISFDLIYEEISPKFKKYKDIELNFERQVLYSNIEMKYLWDCAKKLGKTIIICTDMYLPREFLLEILFKNGFGNFDQLFISGEIGKTKKTGDLFQFVLKQLNLKNNDMLHIGDNKKGDFDVPKRIGIHSILYRQVIEQYYLFNKKAKVFSKIHQSLGQSVLLSVNARYWHEHRFKKIKNGYWDELGYTYAAPLAYGFSKWISGQAKIDGIDHILFVARDGYLLEKAFRYFRTNIKASYIYAPRLFNLICRLDYKKDQIEQAKTIVNYFSECSEEIACLRQSYVFEDKTSYDSFIQQHYSLFEQFAQRNFINYRNYLQQIVEPEEKIAMVDTKTIAFTSQKLLEATLDKQIHGFYWATLLKQQTRSYQYREFIQNYYQKYDGKIFSSNWKFIELLLSAPEYSAQGISECGKPIFKENNSNIDKLLLSNYEKIDYGAGEFFIDLKNIFGDLEINFEQRDLVEWVNIFCAYPNEMDHKYMCEIEISPDVAHMNYESLFLTKTSLMDWVRSPIKTANRVKRSQWHTKSQSLLLNVVKPIKIKFKRKQFFECSLFPYFHKSIFFATMCLSRNFYIIFAIGKHNKK